MMTAKQAELLRFIERYTGEHDGVSPSFDEMRDAMGLCSKSGVMRLLLALEERGFIARHPNRARAIAVLHRMEERALFSVALRSNGDVALDASAELTTRLRDDPLLRVRIYTSIDAALYPDAGARKAVA